MKQREHHAIPLNASVYEQSNRIRRDASATVELYSSDGITPIESHPATVILTIDDGFETDNEEDLAVVEDDDSESGVDEYDANNDGEISIIELGQAGQAFASGVFFHATVDTLDRMFDYRHSNEVFLFSPSIFKMCPGIEGYLGLWGRPSHRS